MRHLSLWSKAWGPADTLSVFRPMCRQPNQDFHWPYPLETLDKRISRHGRYLNLGFLIWCWMPARLVFLSSAQNEISRTAILHRSSCYPKWYRGRGAETEITLPLLRVCIMQSTSLCCKISARKSWLSPDLVILDLRTALLSDILVKAEHKQNYKWFKTSQ